MNKDYEIKYSERIVAEGRILTMSEKTSQHGQPNDKSRNNIVGAGKEEWKIMNRIHPLGLSAWVQTKLAGRKKRVSEIIDYVFTPDGERQEAPPRKGTFFLTTSPVSVTMTELQDGREAVIMRKRWRQIGNHMMDNILGDLGNLSGFHAVTKTYLDCDGIMWRHEKFSDEPDSVTVHRPSDQIIFCEMTLT